MLPSLVRVAVPPAELRITPAAGRPYTGPTVPGAAGLLTENGVACHPPIIDPPAGMLTVTLPPGIVAVPVTAVLSPVMSGTGTVVSTLDGVTPLDGKLTAARLEAVGPGLVALIAVLKFPVVDTLVAVTRTL